jgi:hypothetical protein
MKFVPLGAIEKWLLLEQLNSSSFCTNWLVILDTPLDPALLMGPLADLRRMSRVQFSTLAVRHSDRRIEAELDETRGIENFLA